MKCRRENRSHICQPHATHHIQSRRRREVVERDVAGLFVVWVVALGFCCLDLLFCIRKGTFNRETVKETNGTSKVSMSVSFRSLRRIRSIVLVPRLRLSSVDVTLIAQTSRANVLMVEGTGRGGEGQIYIRGYSFLAQTCIEVIGLRDYLRYFPRDWERLAYLECSTEALSKSPVQIKSKKHWYII